MICGRFACLIIYFTLFGFNPGYSWAAKSNLSNTNTIGEKTLLNENTIISLEQNYSQVQSTPQKKVKEKAIAQNHSLNPEAPSEIERILSLGAMALISLIALFLIWILFREPKQKETLLDLSPADHQSNWSNVAELSTATSATQSDAENNDLLQDVVVTKLDQDKPVDNAWEVKKSAVQDEISQVDIPPNIDLVQEFINYLKHLNNCNDPASMQTILRRRAIWRLAKAEKYYSVEPLLKVVSQVGAADKNLILEAVRQIHQRSYQSINHELFTALNHENPQVRLKALQDLKNLYQFISPVITKIAQMHSDQDYEVRQTAIHILRQFNASPFPTFYNYSDDEVGDLIVGQGSEANLHLVAYLLAELDTEK
ncbi:MAG: hypothetical protein RLZZ69_337 [Cyanobacteriota bacterium]